MAFRPLLPNETAPRCARCHGTSPHSVPGETGATRWLCTACEYEEQFPNRPLIPAAPNTRKPLHLQSEVLFED